MSAVAALSWFLLAALAAGAAAYGGPPLPYDQLPSARVEKQSQQPDSIGAQQSSTMELTDLLWERYYRENPHPAPTIDDVERAGLVDGLQQMPLEYSFPVDFRADGADGLVQVAVLGVNETASGNATTASGTKGIASWLPQRVQSWLPNLPSLSSFIPHLPTYIPGVEVEAEVHRQPASFPHVPTPAELLRRVESIVQGALQGVQRKEQQLVEIIKCTCPRPARCEGLYQEFLSLSGPANPVASSPASPAGASKEPGVSFFAEITKPNGGHGPGFGFFVDQSGPHIGHHVHNSSATASAAASSGAPSPAAPAASAPATASPASDAVEFPNQRLAGI